MAEALDFPGAVTQGFDLSDARLMIASAMRAFVPFMAVSFGVPVLLFYNEGQNPTPTGELGFHFKSDPLGSSRLVINNEAAN